MGGDLSQSPEVHFDGYMPMKMPKLIGVLWRRKLLTALTLIIMILWWRTRVASYWYTVRKPATASSLVLDHGGITVQRVALGDHWRNAAGTEFGASPPVPFSDIMTSDELPSFFSSTGFLRVSTQTPWKYVTIDRTNAGLDSLYGEGRNFFLPFWLMFLALLLLWLRPHRKGIIASVRQKWRPKLEPPPLPPPTIDQGPQPTA